MEWKSRNRSSLVLYLVFVTRPCVAVQDEFSIPFSQCVTSLADEEGRGTRNDDIVGDQTGDGRLPGQTQVRDAAQVGGGSASLARNEGREAGAAAGRGVGESTESGFALGRALNLDVAAGREGANSARGGRGEGEAGESSKDQVGAFWARGDERSGEREDGLGSQGSVEGLGHGCLTRRDADSSLVAALDNGNGRGRSQNRRVLDELSGCKIGRHTNALENVGRGDHACGVGKAEVVLALLDRLDTGLRQRTLQKRDVCLLRSSDRLEVSNLSGVETQRGKLFLGE
jgi:hypothetical protein